MTAPIDAEYRRDMIDRPRRPCGCLVANTPNGNCRHVKRSHSARLSRQTTAELDVDRWCSGIDREDDR